MVVIDRKISFKSCYSLARPYAPYPFEAWLCDSSTTTRRMPGCTKRSSALQPFTFTQMSLAEDRQRTCRKASKMPPRRCRRGGWRERILSDVAWGLRAAYPMRSLVHKYAKSLGLYWKVQLRIHSNTCKSAHTHSTLTLKPLDNTRECALSGEATEMKQVTRGAHR